MLRNYAKIAFKVFLRRKFYTGISLFGTAFTLVVLMVVAALIDYAVGPLAPEIHAARTLKIRQVCLYKDQGNGSYTSSASSLGYAFFERCVRPLSGVEAVAAFVPGQGHVYASGEKVELEIKYVDAAYWRIMAFAFVEGRPFGQEAVADEALVAVINQATQRRFFGERRAAGGYLEVDGRRWRVVGVVENAPAYKANAAADMWVPLSTTPARQHLSRELLGYFEALVLVREKGDIPRVKAEFQELLSRAELPPPYEHLVAGAHTPFEEIAHAIFGSHMEAADHSGRLLAHIVGGMLLFMLLPALNLVNLNMSRLFERSGEIGVRRTFGAPVRALLGQFLVENVLLTLVGGAIGFALSALVLEVLGASELVPHARYYPNYRIFAYGLLAIVCFGLLSGLYPAWRMARLHPVEALKGGAR